MMTDDTTTETTQVVEDNPTTETSEEPQSEGDISDATPEGDDPEADDGPEPQSKREARYRTRLRETEADRDALAATVEVLRRNEVERLAGTELAKGAAIWASGTELTDLLADDGTVSAELVTAAAQSAKQALGLAAAWKAPSVPREGMSYGRSAPPNTWESAFKQQ